MSAKKEKKVRKLKKKRIWPSILFNVVFFVIGSYLVFLFANWFLGYILQTKVDTLSTNAVKLSQTISERIDDSSSKNNKENDKDGNSNNKKDNISKLKEVADLIYENMYDDTEFCIVNNNGDVLVQNSKSTPEKENQIVRNVIDEIGDELSDNKKETTVYIEDNKYVKASDDNSGKITFYDVNLMRLFYESTEKLNNEPSGKKAINIPCWVSNPIKGEHARLFLHGNLAIGFKDVFYLMLACAFMMVIMVVPMIMLLINAISSILTQRKMAVLLYLDTVTGGRNWLYFKSHGERLVQKNSNSKYIYLIMDIQLNKYRNYCLCHSVNAGEELLEEIYNRLSNFTNHGDMCSRYAKSNYVVLLKCVTSDDCNRRTAEIMNLLSSIYPEHRLNFHVGVNRLEPVYNPQKSRCIRRRGVSMSELYNCACAARASLAGKDENAVAYYDKKMLEAQFWEHKVEEMMEKALHDEEFEVYLQPKYSPSEQELVGAEALVRWISPTEGFISPGRFIPIFENNGFVLCLDDYMISHVAKLMSDWIEKGRQPVPVSVNVSRAHFTMPNLAEHIRDLVDVYHTPHELIELELTESAFFDDKETLLNTVKRLKEYGFTVSMDDFGSGYSSLNSLKDLPLDVLKLDAEFFRGEDGGKRGEIVVSEALQLAKSLNMRVVAEGIERKEQVDFLANLNCDMIQGYYFAKPMPVSEFEELSKFKKDTKE